MSESGFSLLEKVLHEAFKQATTGKGNTRHSNGQDFTEQPIFMIQDLVGQGFALGQAIKKLQESQRLPDEHAYQELLGAIIYIASVAVRTKHKINVEKLHDVKSPFDPSILSEVPLDD